MKTLLILLTVIISVMSTICSAQSITTTYVVNTRQVNQQIQSNYKDYEITIKFEVTNITQKQVDNISRDTAYKVTYDKLNMSANIYFTGVIRNQTATQQEIKKYIDDKPQEFNARMSEKIRTGKAN